MNQDMSIVSLVLQASLVVQLVMAGLMLVSLASWTVIFGKLFGLRRVRGGNDNFEREFWSGRSLTEMGQEAANKTDGAPMERIFASGMREFLKLRERRLDGVAQLDGARRAMRASFQREMDVIESHLSFLASVGSVSPYVGLFGTVWGIMHAFVGLSNMTQVTLATGGFEQPMLFPDNDRPGVMLASAKRTSAGFRLRREPDRGSSCPRSERSRRGRAIGPGVPRSGWRRR